MSRSNNDERPAPHVPRDGPATAFAANPGIETLMKRVSSSQKQGQPLNDDEKKETFGLLLVTAWPSIDNSPLRQGYLQFLDLIRDCFQDDVFTNAESDKEHIEDAIYLYRPSCLHITVANFHPFTHASVASLSDDMRNTLQDLWLAILLQASSQNEHWPRRAFQFRVKGAQIGASAGILLWEELTGGLEKARKCLQHQFELWKDTQKETSSVDGDENSSKRNALTLMEQAFDVPSIIHTTFLRFRKVPRTNGHVVQDKFSKLVTPQLVRLFHGRESSPFQVDVMRFVRERSPYMHIPCDDHHVLHTCCLQN